LSRRYLVTGASGFVGAYLARRLAEMDADIHVLVRASSDLGRLAGIESRISVHRVDLLDREGLANALRRLRPTHIWHAATYGGFSHQSESDKISATNFTGTVNLLDAAREVDFAVFINTGSSSEYGMKAQAMREDDELAPLSAYGASKAGATLYAQAMGKSLHLPVYTLRLFSPFGPYEASSRLVPTVIDACLSRRTLRLSRAESVRDFSYVEDAFRAYLALSAGHAPPGEIFNVGSGVQHTVGELAAAAINLSGSTIEIEWGAEAPRPNEPLTWVADIAKARRLLGWSPSYSLEEGLAATIAWAKGERQMVKAS
jgi:nucleoside-diphosphate-sugar epimerase